MSTTIKDLTEQNERRIKSIENEETFGITYTKYYTDLVVDGEEIWIYVFEHENGFTEFQSNLFWSEPLTIYSDGHLSWSSGPPSVAGDNEDSAVVMIQMLKLSRNYL